MMKTLKDSFSAATKQEMEQRLTLLRSYFVGRSDAYGMQAGGTPFVCRQRPNDHVFLAHLRGECRIGIFPMLNGDKVQWLCFDLDEPSLEKAKRIHDQCRVYGLPALVEISRSKGYHITIFFSLPVEAWKVRRLAKRILNDVRVDCEIFPKQDRLNPGAVGNFLFLPWQGGSTAENRTIFIDPVSGQPLDDQCGTLQAYPAVSHELIDQLITTMSLQEPVAGDEPDARRTEGDVILEGRRHDTLVSLAGTMRRRGMTSGEIFPALREINNGRCQPPLPLDEVWLIAKSIMKYEPDCRLPEIDVADRNLPSVTRRAWDAVTALNKPPRLFIQDGLLLRVGITDQGYVAIQHLMEDRLRYEAANAAVWVKKHIRGNSVTTEAAYPPLDVIKNMLATPRPPLPYLKAITKSPIYAADGTLIDEPGYSAITKTFYAPAPAFKVRSFCKTVTQADIDAARGLLENELLVDFPLTGTSEKAHILALLIQQYVREHILGATPLFIIEKPAPGTGATLLIDAVAQINPFLQ